MEGREAGERPDRGVRAPGGRGEGVGCRGQGDGPRVHLSQRGHEVPRHLAAGSVDVRRRRVQLRGDRPHPGHRHPRRLPAARERRRQRELLRGHDGPAVAHPLAGRDPAGTGPRVLRDPSPLVQPHPPRTALLQLDDRGRLRAGRSRAVRPGRLVPGALRPGAHLAGRRRGPIPAALPQQRLRGEQVLPRRRRAERLFRRLLPRRRLRVGSLGTLRGDAGPEDVALGAVAAGRGVGRPADRHGRAVRRVPGRAASWCSIRRGTM